MLLLPPPFGIGQKAYHISIRAPSDKSLDVAVLAKGMGCPDPVAYKVMQCIRHSERYDCLVHDSVNVQRLAVDLRALGGSLSFTVMPRDEVQVAITDKLFYGGRHPSWSASEMNRKYGPRDFDFAGISDGFSIHIDVPFKLHPGEKLTFLGGEFTDA